MSQQFELRSSGPLRVAGFRARTSNGAEMSGTGKIGGLWQQFQERSGESGFEAAPVAVYHDYESDHNGEYSLLVGVPLPESSAPPAGWQVVDVPARDYLVFPVQSGPMPEVLIATWMAVWSHFEKASEFERAYTTDLERHGATTEIHIAVTSRP